MKIRFLLKKKSSDYLIYVALYEREMTAVISTGQRISQSAWNKKEQFPKDHRGPVARAIERVKTDVQRAIMKLELSSDVVTPGTVKAEYQRGLVAASDVKKSANEAAKIQQTGLTRMANEYVENELFRYEKETQKAVTESINAFKEYLKAKGYTRLNRGDLTNTIISGYEKWLLEVKKLSDNAHGKRMKHLRWFLKTIDFDVSRIKLRHNKVTKVSLTLEELNKLEAYSCADSTERQKAKDSFLLGCYTGLRISDIKKLNPINTVGGFIRLRTRKNKKDVTIPIIAEAREILERYNWHAPKLALKNINEHIKVVCENAGINDITVVEKTKAGARLTESGPKHKFISMHISSKTFITLAPKRWGMTPAEIADVVGKNVRTLLNSYFNDQGETGRQKMIEADNRAKMKIAN